MKNILLWLLAVILVGCISDNNSNTPRETIECYLKACASADTIGVKSVSIISDYLLIKSWVVRRISEPIVLCDISMRVLSDSIQVIRDALEICESNIIFLLR